MIEWLTKKQLELQEEFWVEFKVNERWKLYLETNETYNEYIRWEKLKEINNEYDRKIQEYLSEYPSEMQKRFDKRLEKAKKILDWKNDNFIKRLAENKWITPMVYAKEIVDKYNAAEEFILECEIERENKIKNIK